MIGGGTYLECVLQGQWEFHPLPPGLEEFQEVVPEPEDVVTPLVDALDVMEILRLKLVSHSDNGLFGKKVKVRFRPPSQMEIRFFQPKDAKPKREIYLD